MTGGKETIRQQIARLLGETPMTALDLSQAVRIAEKEVYRHLAHIARSVAGRKGALTIIPSTCLACGYSFDNRRRYTRPGRCPRCRESRIDHPVFQITAANPTKRHP